MTYIKLPFNYFFGGTKEYHEKHGPDNFKFEIRTPNFPHPKCCCYDSEYSLHNLCSCQLHLSFTDSSVWILPNALLSQLVFILRRLIEKQQQPVNQWNKKKRLRISCFR